MINFALNSVAAFFSSTAVISAAALASLLILAAVYWVVSRQRRLDQDIDHILESISEGVVIYDREMRLQRCNNTFRETYRLAAPALIKGATLRQILTYGVRAGQWPEALGREEEWISERLAVQSNPAKEMLTNVGDDRWILVRNGLLSDGGTIGIRTDVTDLELAKRDAELRTKELKDLNARLHAALEEITFYANHDILTGLFNRRYFDNFVARDAADSADASEREKLHVMHVDLDRFKPVNDTYGHAAGDEVLKNAASVIRSNIGGDDIAARVGGDEFAVILHGSRSEAEWLEFGEQLVRRLGKSILFDGDEIAVGASIGIAPVGAGRDAIRRAVQNADIALYSAKEAGRDCARYFHADMASVKTRQQEEEETLKAAIANEELVAYYLPQFDAETSECVGAEALVRWIHPGEGVLAPGRFLDIAERVGASAAIDRAVLRQVCRDYAILRALGCAPKRFSVNIAAATVSEVGQWPEVENDAVRDGVIALELHEAIALDQMDDTLRHQIDALRELGFQIEIDDFGAASASIVGVTTVRPDRLKIDRRIVEPAPRSESHRELLTSILEMANALRIDVVAEGVETEEHVRVLRELGFATLQGFAFARPMMFSALCDMLLSTSRGSQAQAETGAR